VGQFFCRARSASDSATDGFIGGVTFMHGRAVWLGGPRSSRTSSGLERPPMAGVVSEVEVAENGGEI
jgi:hypothetical protein